MANGGWQPQQARFENEVLKEWHRRMMEYLAIGLVILAGIGCGIAIVWPTTMTRADDGKTVTLSGPTESTKSAAQTLLTTIVGAAIAYAFKQNARPTPEPPAG